MQIVRRMKCSWMLIILAVCQIAMPHEALAQVDTSAAPSQTRANARLDSLEQLALSSHDEWHAALAIAEFGEWWMLSQRDVTVSPTVVRYPGIVERLVRIYRRSEDYTVRHLIIGRMIRQAERAQAVAFLTELARQPREPGPPPPPGIAVVADDTRSPPQLDAVSALTHMGAEGRTALEQLHTQGTVQEPMARAQLDTLASHGFQMPSRQ